jgi:pseudoazurin
MNVKSMLFAAATLFAVAALGSGVAGAAEHEVKMLNKGERGAMVFEPAFLKIAPGDSVKFVPTDKSHNAESIEGFLPAGAEPFAGKMNQEIVVTFDAEGVYGYKCRPHYGMGMVGMVVVGDAAANLDDAKALPQKGKAKKAFAELFEELGS